MFHVWCKLQLLNQQLARKLCYVNTNIIYTNKCSLLALFKEVLLYINKIGPWECRGRGREGEREGWREGGREGHRQTDR